MEVTSLKHHALPTRPAPGPLLRLASDERLITLIRRGHHAAFEALVQRYQSRLLAFCRHMLGSREDAEDVLQDVFAAAFNAILADEREINVRPWLYRIARNRSLNHLRRASAVGVDSMDTYFADHGQSVPERILQRESFRALVDDIGHLAETQRTALLLREIDALSYEQIAEVMDTTVPSVKSLLVRARVVLAEAAEARKLSCEEVRQELGEVAEGLVRITPPVRRHVRDCPRCRSFSKQLKRNERALAALLPVGGLPALLHRLIATKLGSTSAGGAYAAGGGGAGASAGTGAGIAAGAGAGAASGLGGVGGVAGFGSGAIAAKAVAGLAAAALLTAGAVEVGHGVRRVPSQPSPQPAATGLSESAGDAAPAVVSSAPQALTATRAPLVATRHLVRNASPLGPHPRQRAVSKSAARTRAVKLPRSVAAASALGVHGSKAHDSSSPAASQVVEVATSTTQLPTVAVSSPSSSPSSPAPTSAQSSAPAATPEAPAGSSGPSGPTGATGEAAQGVPEAAPVTPTESASGGAEAPAGAAEPSPAG
jgi:RNA polymerase sigma factor (sigma-70 family)